MQILEICTTIFKFAPRIFREKAMATVTAFIRVSTKRKDKANVRFRLRDGRAVQLLYVSDLTVNPDHWNPKKEEIKAKILMDPAERAEFNRTVALRKSQITDLYNAAPDKSVLTSEWLSAEMYKLLHPAVKRQEGMSSFFDDFDYFLETRKLSDVRTRNFRVIYRALQRLELYRRINVSKKFRLTFDVVTPDILREFESFLRKEHTFFTRDEETGKFICSRAYKPVYDAFPETRTPQPPGTICTPHQLPTSRVQKPGKTALDTLFFLGIASTSTAKVHAILSNFSKVLPISCKCYISVIHL